MIGLGLLVGLVISIFQATTQIQEQTLTFVPKIVAVLVAGVVVGPWMLRTMIEFSERLLSRAHDYIRGWLTPQPYSAGYWHSYRSLSRWSRCHYHRPSAHQEYRPPPGWALRLTSHRP